MCHCEAVCGTFFYRNIRLYQLYAVINRSCINCIYVDCIVLDDRCSFAAILRHKNPVFCISQILGLTKITIYYIIAIFIRITNYNFTLWLCHIFVIRLLLVYSHIINI